MGGMTTKVDLATNTVFLINASGGEPDKPSPDSGEVIQMPQIVSDAGKAALQTLKPGDQITTVYSAADRAQGHDHPLSVCAYRRRRRRGRKVPAFSCRRFTSRQRGAS